MCDMDWSSEEGFDVSEEVECTSEFDVMDEDSSFAELDDITDLDEGCSEEINLSSIEPDDCEEFPSLAEYSDLIEETDDVEELSNIKDALISGEFSAEGLEEDTEDGDIKVLTREITPEILESREKDTEELLENYRENLRDREVGDKQIEEFIEQEREKIYAEYESLDRGDTSSNIYYMPTDWDVVAENLMEDENVDEIVDEQQFEEEISELSEVDVDYETIYEEIENEALAEGYKDINIEENAEALEESLESFEEDTWQNLELYEQREAIDGLSNYIKDIIGFENPPAIEYYNSTREGEYGGYDPATNTLHINEYMLYNSTEAADTIAHELWHAHQQECASNPKSARDYQYQYNFENYISPEYGFEQYQNQLVEAEARSFAAQFRERIENGKGRVR